MGKIGAFVARLCAEPPFRVLTKSVVKRVARSVRHKALWDATDRPHYLNGVLAGADQALREGRRSMSVFEFGVAGGNGLLSLAECGAAVERETGLQIKVYGFDTGSGLTPLVSGYKDCPDHWQGGDYPMDEAALRARLPKNTELILGDVAETVPYYSPRIAEPIGFVACDLDTYSATKSMLRMFSDPKRNMLLHVPVYFDDIEYFFMHQFAGELAAISEFNAESHDVKIDVWRGISKHRPFPEAYWLQKMFIAHDLRAIEKSVLSRSASVLRIDQSDYQVA